MDSDFGLIEPIIKGQSSDFDKDSLQHILSEVFDFAESEDWGSAVNSLRKLVKQSPSALTYSLLGLAYYKIDELTKAANALEISVKLNPHESTTQFFLGFIYFLQKKPVKAVASFNKAIQLNSKDAKIHFCLGVAHHSLKHWQLAIDSYQHAIRLKGNSLLGYLYFFLANAYEGLGKEKSSKQEEFINKAMATYQQVLRIEPKHIQALNALGEIHFLLGRLDEAEKVLEKALKIDPHNAEALNQLRLVKEDQLEKRLFESGYLKKINEPITDFTPYKNRKTIKIKGKPLSETVIEDRR